MSSTYGFPTEELRIMIDSSKLEIVLRNYLSNAIKFSPTNSKVYVLLSIQPHFTCKPSEMTGSFHGILHISITDQGPGISKVRFIEIID